MKFKGSIIITDPCYILKDEDWTYDYCMPKGFTDYIRRNTIYGDWSCMTYKGTPDTDLPARYDEIHSKFFHDHSLIGKTAEEKHETYKSFSKIKSQWIKDNCYGQFCADSGEVCIVYLDEVLKYNSKFETFIKEHPWCVTIIEDFEGEIEELVEEDSLMFIGTGNKPFFTIQSGL